MDSGASLDVKLSSYLAPQCNRLVPDTSLTEWKTPHQQIAQLVLADGRQGGTHVRHQELVIHVQWTRERRLTSSFLLIQHCDAIAYSQTYCALGGEMYLSYKSQLLLAYGAHDETGASCEGLMVQAQWTQGRHRTSSFLRI